MARKKTITRDFIRIPAIRLTTPEDVQIAKDLGFPSVRLNSVLEFPGESEKRNRICDDINRRAEIIRRARK